MAPSKQVIEAPADEYELTVEFLRRQLLQPFSNARKPIEEAREIMKQDNVSEKLINQNLSWDKGPLERNRADFIKYTTNPKTGRLWDLTTMENAGLVSTSEKENIIREHNGREPPYWYVSSINRAYDSRTGKSYLTAHCMVEGILVGKRENVVNELPNRRINTHWTMGVERSIPIVWNPVNDNGEEKSVASYNERFWDEGINAKKIYTIPFTKETAEKLLAKGLDGLPSMSIQDLTNHRDYGVKSVEEFLAEDKDLPELIKSYEVPAPAKDLQNFVAEFKRQNQNQDTKELLRDLVAEFRRQSISEAEENTEAYK